jgi:PAS domain S-box-containing protein
MSVKPENSDHRLQSAALEAAANAIVITNSAGVIVWANRALTAMTGYDREEIIGKTPQALKSGVHGSEFYSALWATILAGRVWHGEVVNRRKDGSLYTEEMTITPFPSDVGQPTHFIAIKQDVSARKAAEAALRQAEEKYRTIFENSVMGIFQSTPEGRFLTMNRALAEMYGYSSAAEAVASITDIGQQLYGDGALRKRLLAALDAKGELRDVQIEVIRKDGARLWLSYNVRCINDADGKLLHYEGLVENVGEWKALERQLQQTQKLEAVGRLAGGVAHDFNNMLGIISGYCEILKDRRDLETGMLADLEEIHKASRKAAALTQQLLAFSRKQVIQPRHVDLNEVLMEISKMLRRLIGDDVEMRMNLCPSEVVVLADQGQLQQVVMNLTVNARDAMPEGGTLTIATEVCDLDQSYAIQHYPVVPGPYALLSVTDSGMGMDGDTLSHLFEPFFTTKELGRGTGLGLSIVYGIVKQSEGYIWAYSEPGNGSCLKIYLPLRKAAVEAVAALPDITSVRGTETILIVEDNVHLRELMAGYLRALGYQVLEDGDGRSALDRVATQETNIDVVVTDIMMPGMGGRELAQRIVAMGRPPKLLLMSGYTHDPDQQSRAMHEGETFLQKPFALKDLAVKVRQLLA